jgi:hypothetical protein
MKPIGLVLVASCVAALAGCASSGRCGSHKCPAPEPPPTTIHLSLAGQTFALTPGQSHPISIRLGRPVTISITISSPTGATVKGVYLVVNSYPSGVGSGGPTGKVKILYHHAGQLATNHSITASWIPETLFGTNRLDLTLDYSVGDTAIGSPIANMTLTT